MAIAFTFALIASRSRSMARVTTDPTSACCRLSVTPVMASVMMFEARVRRTPSTLTLESLPAVTCRWRPTVSASCRPNDTVELSDARVAETESVSCESPVTESVSTIFPATKVAIAGREPAPNPVVASLILLSSVWTVSAAPIVNVVLATADPLPDKPWMEKVSPATSPREFPLTERALSRVVAVAVAPSASV